MADDHDGARQQVRTDPVRADGSSPNGSFDASFDASFDDPAGSDDHGSFDDDPDLANDAVFDIGSDVFADDPRDRAEDEVVSAQDVLETDTAPVVGSGRQTRSETRRLQRASRQRKRGRFVLILGLILLLGIGGVGWFVLRPALVSTFGASDYSGAGTGDVVVQVKPGDGAAAIAGTLHADGVTRSDRAFILAAADNSKSTTIRPGSYRLHKQMQASQALTVLLNGPVTISVTIPEGQTILDVVGKLTKDLGLHANDMTAVTANPTGLGLPGAYTPASGPLTSLEGFLFPDTYSFDLGTSASDAMSTLVNEFIATDRTTHFSDRAKVLGLTSYQALIIASMVEGEAKFDEDRPKVARVILNRLAADRPLQIDATSVYGALITGRNPASLTYNEADPYNTRNTKGLPPTPIGNPGAASLTAAVTPTAGAWTHYVNGSSDGHLVFTDEAGFEAARLACVQNNWGCD